MIKLNEKFHEDSLLYPLSHFGCEGRHAVHMLIQLPPLTSTVKSSLFTPVLSSPLSLAAWLHQCHTNCFHYINNGWTFSRQTLYTMFWSWADHSDLLLVGVRRVGLYNPTLIRHWTQASLGRGHGLAWSLSLQPRQRGLRVEGHCCHTPRSWEHSSSSNLRRD